MFIEMICLDPGEQENIDKFTRRLVKVTKHHNDECKKLLTLMGVPYVEVRSTLTLLLLLDLYQKRLFH